MSTDFEIGHFLRARVIPKAALYYTGDIVDDDDDDDFDEGNGKNNVCEIEQIFFHKYVCIEYFRRGRRRGRR